MSGIMNSPKLSTLFHSSSLLPVARTTVWRAAALSLHVSHPHQGDENRGGADPRNMNTPPIEDPQHIKKEISVGSNDNGKGTYNNDGDEEGSDTEDEGASTLLKDQSGAQDQSSS